MARNERSAGFVVFCTSEETTPAKGKLPWHSEAERTVYLLLDHGRHWSFPKGHVEKGEVDLEAAVRELQEETGIVDPRIIPGFRHEIHYFFRHRNHGLVRKTVTYFLAQVTGRQIVLSREHIAAEFLAYERAIRQVTFASDREVLRRAHAYVAAHPPLDSTTT